MQFLGYCSLSLAKATGIYVELPNLQCGEETKKKVHHLLSSVALSKRGRNFLDIHFLPPNPNDRKILPRLCVRDKRILCTFKRIKKNFCSFSLSAKAGPYAAR